MRGEPATARPLLDELKRTADAELEARRARAVADAAAIRAQAEAEAHRRVEAARALADVEATRLLAVERADAARRARAAILPARADALDRVFAHAAACIERRAAHPDARAAVTTLVRDAISYLPDGDVVIRCGSAATLAARDAATGLTRPVRIVDDPTVPLGAIVGSDDGRVLVDATFARRLARTRAALAAAIARRITEQSP